MPKVDRGAAPYWQTTDGETARVYRGDVLETLRGLPSGSVQCCVTSPPYWGLRDYKTGSWEGGDPACDHIRTTAESSARALTLGPKKDGLGPANAAHQAKVTQYRKKCQKCGATRVDRQLGSEAVHDCEGRKFVGNCAEKDWATGCHVCRMVLVCRELRRVLRDDGTFFLNYGDSYASGGRVGHGTRQGHKQQTNRGMNGKNDPARVDAGLPDGNLCGIPWRVALALQADGWVLRSDIPWVKRSPMPESSDSRPAKALEYVFMLTKGMGYYFDMEAIKPRAVKGSAGAGDSSYRPGVNGRVSAGQTEQTAEAGRNFRQADMWYQSVAGPYGLTGTGDEIVGVDVTSPGYEGAHFACVDDRTEALTKDGWRPWQYLISGYTEIAAYDRDKDKLCWQVATVHTYPYKGRVVHFDKRDTSQILTPNHRCLVRSRKGKIKVRRADEVGPRDQFLMTAEFDEKPQKSIGEDMAALLGWFLSEGHFADGSNYRAHISQSNTANPDNVREIENLLIRLGAKYRKRSRVSRRYDGTPREEVSFSIGGMIEWELLSMGIAKRIEPWMTRLPKNELKAFFDAFVSGDGHRRPDGRSSIVQKKQSDCDQLQIMAIKLGYRAFIGNKSSPTSAHHISLTSGRWLLACGKGGAWEGTPYKDYEGGVWCPSVPSGFWLARRDGKPFITGNTFPPKLIEPMILAGTSEKGCCPDCCVPWNRVTEKTALLRTRPNDYVKRTGAAGTGNSCANTVAGVAVKTVGWEPGCGCRGEIVRRKVVDTRRVIDAADKKSGDRLDTGMNSKSTTLTSRGFLNAESHEEEREITITEYVSDLPLADHPVVPCTVCDIFLGSGTTICVALANGRRGWGIELSEAYIRANAVPRIEGVLGSRPALAGLIPRAARKVTFG